MLVEFLTKHGSTTVNKEDISIPEDLSSLGGALYVAVLKNVAEENWEREFDQYLNDFKKTLLEVNNGEIDEKSCLTELAAAQISAPAIEGGYDKTTAAIEKASNVLNLDEKKIESPKYMSLGRRFLNWINHKPRCIIAAALAAGILFAGTGNTPLIGPGAAYGASNLSSKITSAITKGVDVDFSKGSFYNGKSVQRKLTRIGTDTVEDVVEGAISGTLNGIFGNTKSSTKSKSTKALTPDKIVSQVLYDDSFNLSPKEQETALTGAYLLKYIPTGLTAKELSMAVTILSPDSDNKTISNIARCIAYMGAYDNETDIYSMPANRSEALAKQMKKRNKKFNEYESIISFATSLTKIGQNVSLNGGTLDDTFISLTQKAQAGMKAVYDSPVVEKMKEFTTESQLKLKNAAKDVASSMKDYGFEI